MPVHALPLLSVRHMSSNASGGMSGWGHEADVVHNGQQVLEAVSRTRYDWVLMDCMMPVIALTAQCSIFLLTGYKPHANWVKSPILYI